ncbi:MAG: exodeoxyribonuclease III [Candidatus Yonathbacteria bacterium RIFCSPHIGHO2_01_FULL_51_10]|uniref:Exodeoxyribonuclease III n=1 Tax=Candidatus Yonathbacteria bacterium RIFCSPHIGHO2_01_FULL_51_10 TaxID=1802723 RepID=A0A1G2S3C1_9BACT|nr:MAG: exodeoxyribonuclease III [Candidatus Yonathbacteria bacterium RIFCSPHIGHO2_01_FULL_51_10]
MKIISWNVNGLRSIGRNGFWKDILKQDPDILCLQETKAEAEQLPDEVRNPTGYHAYFASSKLRKGYSGVAVYTKEEPEKVEYGMGIKKFDDEGRTLVLYFKDFVLLNVYFPNGGGGPHRLEYKLEFYDVFLKFIDALQAGGKKIIFCGDINTAHEEIDLARPKENEKNTGFLPEERAWLDEVVAHGYVDTFRHFYPTKVGAYTYWDMKTAARDRNVGWRIDYFFVSADLMNKISGTKILADMYGSDHCPLELLLK